MKKITFIFSLLSSIALYAQPASEIILFDVSTVKGNMIVNNPVNISNHPGYDNQPSFHTNNSLIYYSSFNEEGRSDIKVYDLKKKTTTLLTKTSEREYSPTLTPDEMFISCIIQRDNDAQDLGKYPVKGGEPITLIDNLIVGYHAWIDQNNILLFVLGEPNTLRWFDLQSGKDEIIAENVGRSLHKIPNQQAMSFVDKSSEGHWMINKLDIQSKKITPVVETMPGQEDMTWTQKGEIIMSDGEKLFTCDPSKDKKWREIEMHSGGLEIEGITRLAISKNGKNLVVVASEP